MERPTIDRTQASMPEISPDTIRTQLELILTSPRFLASESLSRFLRYVVEETLAGRKDQIKQYTVGVRALGREPNFDPQSDPIVRIHARRLRRALYRYYETDSPSDPIRIEIPKGRYIPIFLPIGGGGWNAEVVDQRSKFPGMAQDPMVAPRSGISLVVLPFKYLGNNKEEAYMAGGMTEDILIVLTSYSDLSVVGPLSRERLESEGAGSVAIGQRYGVRFLLDGSVRCHGQRIRIGARLVDTKSGSHVWAETYDRMLDEQALMDIEHDISLSILGAIADIHGVINTTLIKEIRNRSETTLTAHQAMLKFYDYLHAISPERLKAARSALENGVKSSPEYGPAWAALGSLCVDEHLHFGAPASALQEALILVEDACRLNPTDYLVQSLRAFVFFFTRNRSVFLRAAESAVDINPRNSFTGDLAVFCCLAGEPERGMALFEEASRTNPHHPGYYFYTPYLAYAYRGDFEEALACARKIRMPHSYIDPLARAVALGHLGRQNDANAAVSDLLILRPDFATEGVETIRRVFRHEKPVKLMIEGLSKAGLDAVN